MKRRVLKFCIDNPYYLAGAVSESYPDISKVMQLGFDESFRRTERNLDELT